MMEDAPTTETIAYFSTTKTIRHLRYSPCVYIYTGIVVFSQNPVGGNLKTRYMTKVLLPFASFMLISSLSFSQTINASPPNALDSLNEIYSVVDKEAKFPGSTKDWEKYLLKNLKIDMPVRNGAPDGNYLVITTFKVAIDGEISDVNPETKIGYGMEEEVIRMIKKCPNWERALRYGRKVNSLKRQRITFVVATK